CAAGSPTRRSGSGNCSREPREALKIVAPAEAGVQFLEKSWVPACAGTTIHRFLRDSLDGLQPARPAKLAHQRAGGRFASLLVKQDFAVAHGERTSRDH